MTFGFTLPAKAAAPILLPALWKPSPSASGYWRGIRLWGVAVTRICVLAYAASRLTTTSSSTVSKRMTWC